MKVALVGGTGNISTSIARVLLENGHEVVCFNRGQSGVSPLGIRTIVGDRSDCERFEGATQRGKFDAAIDMICFNADQARSSVRAFRGVRHFIQCSTICTYGVDYDQLPVTEAHPLRPITDYGRNKAAADDIFLSAFEREQFPATIVKPSTTYGPRMGLLRQVAWDFGWIDRIRKGKPILVCDQGAAMHQFLHVDDAAPAFEGILGQAHCVGQIYNLVPREATTWAEYHRLAMKTLGRDAELASVSLRELMEKSADRFAICNHIFAHDTVYSPDRLFRDVPGFYPRISLEEGMRGVIEAMDRDNRIPNSDSETWEDEIIAATVGVARL